MPAPAEANWSPASAAPHGRTPATGVRQGSTLTTFPSLIVTRPRGDPAPAERFMAASLATRALHEGVQKSPGSTTTPVQPTETDIGR